MNDRPVRKLVGSMLVLVMGPVTCQTWSQEVVIAMDDASQSAYSDGWQVGDNGGFGFQAWEFDSFFESAFSPRPDGELIAENTFVDIPSNGPAFGQTNANRPYWGYTSWAMRPSVSWRDGFGDYRQQYCDRE